MTDREWPVHRARAWLLRKAAELAERHDISRAEWLSGWALEEDPVHGAACSEKRFREFTGNNEDVFAAAEIDRAVADIYGDVPTVPPKTGATSGLWRKRGIAGGKYLIQRRDGSVPEWPSFVLGAKDPAAPAGLRGYADKAEELGFDPAYVADVRGLAPEFEAYRVEHGAGDPDGVPHRKDDPTTVEKMQRGGNA